MSDFPTFSEFKSSLNEDHLFQDSFNLFLNLPVFANRLHYIQETEDFHVYPSPNSKLVDFDQSNVFQWVYSHRLPLFWISEFYYGYRLGHVLFNQSHEDLIDNSNVAEFIDTNRTTKQLQKFLLFLRGSYGEAYCLFWLDIERLKHTINSNMKKHLVEKIKTHYLRHGAPFEFDAELRKDIYFASCEAKSQAEEIAIFILSQSRVMPMIKMYWFERYIRQAVRPKSSIADHLDNSDSTESIGDSEEFVNDSLPRVIVDEGKEKEENIENQHEDLKELIEAQPMFNIKERRASENNFMLKAKPLLSSSTHELFDLSNKQSEQHEHIVQNITPFMQACIRSNFAAGNPVLNFFKDKFYDTENLPHDPINLLLLWLSIECVLTKDEMKRWYNSVKPSYFDSECPYFSLFQEYPCATDLDSLLEMFIDDNSEFYVGLPNEYQEQLNLLIPKGLGKGLLLETQDYVCMNLQPFWEEYIVHDNDLFQAECVDQKDLSHLSDSIQQEQTRLFHESRLAKSIFHAAFDSTDKTEVKKIWRAVEFTEAVVNPGLLHLPSRLSMEIYSKPVPLEVQKSLYEQRSFGATTPGDIGPITYRGIHLIPMVTTVSTKTHRTAYKMTRITVYSSQPATIGTTLTKKPSLPMSFIEMLRNNDHIESFYNFLASNGNGVEMTLVFWLAVEDMKDSIGDCGNCRVKIRRIMRRFFKTGMDMSIFCKDTTMLDLATSSDPDPFLLMDGQAAIAKMLENDWYEQYLTFLSDSYTNEDTVITYNNKKTDKKQAISTNRSVVREHTKGLWNMFTKNVIGFRRGTMDPKVLVLFKKYLAQEVLRGDGADRKKIMGTKVITISKLLNDLSFWTEVERYKDMADVVRAAKSSGTYTPEDEIMVYKKAHAIVNCYIDSTVSPKVQVNVSAETVAAILENLSQSTIGRGLFHEAALSIFSILIHYWKKFCLWRWSPKKSGSSSSVNSNSTSYSFGNNGGRGTSNSLQHQDSEDMIGSCLLSFSLRKGLRLILPPSVQANYNPFTRNNANLNKVQVYKIESARTMMAQHLSRVITTVQ